MFVLGILPNVQAQEECSLATLQGEYLVTGGAQAQEGCSLATLQGDYLVTGGPSAH